MSMYVEPDDPEERKRLAEQWRVLGEKLRGRSPALFRKVVAMLVGSGVDDADGAQENIDDVYPYH